MVEPCPVDCEWASWTGWSKCSAFWGEGGTCDEQCGEGRHIRQRQALTPAQYGGKLLEGPSAESKTCKIKECPIDCEVSAWAKASDCDVTCGGGYFTMTRTITTDAQHEGAA